MAHESMLLVWVPHEGEVEHHKWCYACYRSCHVNIHNLTHVLAKTDLQHDHQKHKPTKTTHHSTAYSSSLNTVRTGFDGSSAAKG